MCVACVGNFWEHTLEEISHSTPRGCDGEQKKLPVAVAHMRKDDMIMGRRDRAGN